MLNEDLLSEKYYLSKLSMFMKESYGFLDSHFKIMLDHIQDLNTMCDFTINILDIWNPDYKKDLIATFGNETPFKPLDIIASVVGCSRVNTYQDGEGYKSISLNNSDLIDLIKIHIVQNNYKGTFEQLNDLYKNKLGIEFYMLLIPDSNIEGAYIPATAAIYINKHKNVLTTDTSFEEGKDYFQKIDGNYVIYAGDRTGNPNELGLFEKEELSQNLLNLYKYSDLFIRSLGITYQISIVSSPEQIFTLNQDTLGSDKVLG